MAKLVLQLAFVASALGFVFPKCSEGFNMPPTQFIVLGLHIPAVLMGSLYWWKGRGFAGSWPVIACATLVWIGLAYAGNSESDRGLLIAALVTIVLPVSALIVEKRAWLMCAKTYVIANGVALAMALWYETNGGDLGHSWVLLYRFGFLWAENGSTALANPNQVGGQLAFASIIAFIIHLREHSSQERRAAGPVGANLYLGLAVSLSLGCLLTASRGAAASWLVGMGMLAIWGTRSLSLARQKGLAFLMAGGVLMSMFAMVVGGLSPWDSLQKRIGEDSVFSAGNRMELWQDAFTAWTSDPDFFFRGTGTGMADGVLGRITVDAELDNYGALRKNCHNSYVEWILSFGLLGIVCGTALMASMLHKALLLDRGEQNVGRLAILLAALVYALTAVSYRHTCWIATGSLMLAMVSGTPARRGEAGAGTSRLQSSTDIPGPHSARPGRGRPRGDSRGRTFDSAPTKPHNQVSEREAKANGT